MATALKIEVVSPAKWERLQREGKACECVTMSLGFADPVRGRAYVRDTAVPELNKYLVNHEAEHLLEHEATDECPHGFRHKGFVDALRNMVAVSLAPFTGGASLSLGSQGFREEASDIIPRELTQEGPLGGFSTLNPSQPIGRTLRGGAPAWGTAGAALGAITGPGIFARGAQLGQKIPTAIQAPGAGSLASLGSAPGGAGEAAGGLGRFIRPLAQTGYNPSAASGIKAATNFAGTGPAVGGNFGTTFSALSGGGRPPVPPTGIPQQLGSAVSTAAQGAQPAAPAVQKTLSQFGIGKLAGPLALGGGLSAIGDIFAKKPQAPDFGSLSSVQELMKSVGGKGLSPLGQLGQQQLSSRLSSPFTGLEPGAEQSVRDTFAQQRKNLISQFKAIRPNADLTTDSAYRQALFELDQQEGQAIGNLKEGAYQNFQQTRTQDIAQALGVDTQSIQTLAQLAQLDIATIMTQLGVDAAEAQQFKQTWSNLGIVGAIGAMGGFNGGTP